MKQIARVNDYYIVLGCIKININIIVYTYLDFNCRSKFPQRSNNKINNILSISFQYSYVWSCHQLWQLCVNILKERWYWMSIWEYFKECFIVVKLKHKYLFLLHYLVLLSYHKYHDVWIRLCYVVDVRYRRIIQDMGIVIFTSRKI